MAKRCRKQPLTIRAAKNSLDSALHPNVDAALKQLKSCARGLQPVLSTFSDELQILHRLYYKGKNQHRPALFWRRVTEMRRYGDRVEELSLLSLVDSLRFSFFGEELQQTSKLLKGSWTHYPDTSSVSFVLERIEGSITLVQKMHECLAHAYQSFSLAMQTGAFIQLILTLAGIASRMSSLASELSQALELTRDAVYRILVTLDPKFDSEPRRRRMLRHGQSLHPIHASVGGSTDVYEDTGVSIGRQDPRSEISPPPYTITDAPCPPVRAPPDSIGVERSLVVKKLKRSTGDSESKPKKKQKVKRDEIDDIFG
ncbi:hypothetical protein DFH06DRAFT_1157583 [Mycena polygramma]|nr:hypothetical protein DFH06DRAFT_1157583 [Mycena polygramma]